MKWAFWFFLMFYLVGSYFLCAADPADIARVVIDFLKDPEIRESVLRLGKPVWDGAKDFLVTRFLSQNPSLNANDALQTLQEEYIRAYQSVDGMSYDFVIRASSLLGLRAGWEIDPCDHKDMELNGPVIGWAGLFNSGKTFILNLIETWKLPSGILSVTEGISVKRSSLNGAVTHLDMQGSNRLVSPNSQVATSVEDRLATDRFLEEIVLEKSGKLFFVVNTLQVNEIYNINELFERYLELRRDRPREMFVIHNFLDFCKEEEVNKHIQDDIVLAFQAVPDPKLKTLWRSHGEQVVHLVFAREGTTAGEVFNHVALEHLRNIVRGALTSGPASDAEKNLLESMRKTATAMLDDYFHPIGANLNNLPQPSSRITVGQPVPVEPQDPEPNAFKKFAVNLWKSVTSSASHHFSQNHSAESVVEADPFELVFVTSPAGAGKCTKLLKLARDFELVYLPRYGLPIPDSKFKPTWDVIYWEEGETRAWYIFVDLPGMIKAPRLSCSVKDQSLLLISAQRRAPKISVSQFSNIRHRRRFGEIELAIRLPQALNCFSLLSSAKEQQRLWYYNGVLGLTNQKLPSPDQYLASDEVELIIPEHASLPELSELF